MPARSTTVAAPHAHRWRPRVDFRMVHACRGIVRALHALNPTRIEGVEHLPDGPALLVGNHGLLGYETPFFFEALYRETGRLPLGLADRWFFRVPILRNVLVRVGGMYGTPELALAALEEGHLVVCYPGGAHETFKRHGGQRYQLQWDNSLGFARVALRAGVPIVPFAAAGVDDTFAILSRVHGSGRVLMGDEKYDLPLVAGLGPLPLPVPFWFRLGRPIGVGCGAQHADPARVAAVHGRVRDAAGALLAELLAEWRAIYRRGGDDHDERRSPAPRALARAVGGASR